MIKSMTQSQNLRRFAGCLILGAMTFVMADTAEFKNAVATPYISAVRPAAAFGGPSVVIEGNNLSGATKVIYGGKFLAKFKVNSDSEIEAIVPKEARNGRISVFSAGGEYTSGLVFAVKEGRH